MDFDNIRIAGEMSLPKTDLSKGSVKESEMASTYATDNKKSLTNKSVESKSRDADSNSGNEKRENDGYEYASNTKNSINRAIEQANEKLKVVNKEFSYQLHEKTKQIMVKVMDTETGEVIKEIPPKESLDMIARMWEMAGVIVDEKR